MPKEVTRDISRPVETELWGRAAGRCEFDGCNRIVYKSPLTQDPVNISEKAHIYSFSKDGPRGWGPFKKMPKGLNDAGNLMLVCHDCHKTIDKDKNGAKYSADLLIEWKKKHENRIKIVTSVAANKHSLVVLYGANIGMESSVLQPLAANDALFPDWYPAEEHPLQLSMRWNGRDKNISFWDTEGQNLKECFGRQILPRIQDQNCPHFSVFGLAPMPLLMLLGTLFTDKTPVQVYQLHREPSTWMWQTGPSGFAFKSIPPNNFDHPPALVFSLSAKIEAERITAVMGEKVSIWEITIDAPDTDFLKSKEQLSLFRKNVRELIIQIAEKHGQTAPISIFPAMPVACAVEVGRMRMPKADSDWIIYDQSNEHKKFIKALVIGGTENGK
jgi:hypothetical protein